MEGSKGVKDDREENACTYPVHRLPFRQSFLKQVDIIQTGIPEHQVISWKKVLESQSFSQKIHSQGNAQIEADGPGRFPEQQEDNDSQCLVYRREHPEEISGVDIFEIIPCH